MEKYDHKEMALRNLKNTIMGQMNQVERRTGKLFHENYGALEKRIWEAIDTNNMSEMRQIIKDLDELT